MNTKMKITKNSVFKKEGFYVYENAISEDAVNLLRIQFEMLMNMRINKFLIPIRNMHIMHLKV